MNKLLLRVAVVASIIPLTGADWLQFRGPNGAGVTLDAAPPDSFTEEKNVAWKADLSGRAASGPIIVGGRVVLTANEGANQDKLLVYSFDVETGKQQWKRQFWATGRTLTHPFSAVAAPTPASDGERIFAFYSSNDLVCLDLEGNLVWYRGLAFDYPKAGNDIGMASSPVVAGETVVVQIESQGDGFAAGIDTKTGETRWRVERDRNANWASPVAMSLKGRDIVLLQSGSGLTGHDALTGEVVWRYDAGCSTTPSLAVSGDRIYLPSKGVTALNVSSDGSSVSLAWDSNRLSPGSASPVVDGKHVYTINGAGVLTCGDIENGDRVWQVRLGGRHWATPIVAGDRIFCINSDGVARVVQLGDKGKVVGTSEFGETIKSSPAAANGALYVRSDQHLWKIAAE